MIAWVDAVERAYVAAATGGYARRAVTPVADPRARAALGAIASRYLAVGTPRTLGLVADTAADALASIEAHRVYFTPRELRTTVELDGATTVSLAEALACDIVCVHVPIELAAIQLRRGTHVNALARVTLDDELRQLATIVEEEPGLGALAAGLVDGRQLDELTVFVAGAGAIAAGALLT